MKNVATLFGKTARKTRKYKNTVEWPLPDQLIGLEIEAEATKGSVHPDDFFPYWRRERDGSLRSGHEYVLAQPLKGDTLSKAIQDIFANGTVFHRTATGSTHVHVDMMEDGVSQDTLKALVLLIYALEPAIFAITDPGREWCGYTNKLTSAPDELVSSILNANEEDYRDLLNLCSDGFRTGRYYGINMLALAKYGSVEFRYFPTACSEEELVDWVKLVQSFKKAAMEVGGVAGVNRVLSSEDLYESFINNYFGPWKVEFLKEVPQWQARSAIHKALAIASSTAIMKDKPIEPFNEDAVWKNKVLATRFAKKRNNNGPARNGNMVWIGYDAPFPAATSYGVGTMAYQRERIYINDGFNHWVRAPYIGSPGRLTNEIRNQCISTLRAFTGRQWRDLYTRNGMGTDPDIMPLVVDQTVRNLQDAIRRQEQNDLIARQQEDILRRQAEQAAVRPPAPAARGVPRPSPFDIESYWGPNGPSVQNLPRVRPTPVVVEQGPVVGPPNDWVTTYEDLVPSPTQATRNALYQREIERMREVTRRMQTDSPAEMLETRTNSEQENN